MHSSADNLRLPHGLGIRPATDGDGRFLQSLYHSTRSDLQCVVAEDGFVEELIAQQFMAQSTEYGKMFPNACYFIIEKQRQPIGRVTLNFREELIHIVDIAFIQKARGKGYGEGVLRALQYAAGKTGAPLLLSVSVLNLAAKRLYLRLGFQVERSVPPYERMIWYPAIRAEQERLGNPA